MRLIDSEPLLDMLEREENENEDIPNRSDGIRDAIIDILNAPTVEAVKGDKWGSDDWALIMLLSPFPILSIALLIYVLMGGGF